MKKLALLTCLSATALFSAISCKKEPEPTPKSGMELLTNNSSKQWLTTSIMEGGQEVIEECDKDDVYTFYVDKRLTVDFFTKCDSADDDSLSFNWDFAGNRLRVVEDGDTSDVNIDVLSEKKLVISDGSFTQTFRAK